MRQRKRSTTGQGDERNEAGSEPRQRKRSNEVLSREGSVRRTDAGNSPLRQARDQRDPPSSGKPRSDTSWIKPHGANDGKSDAGKSFGTAEDAASVARTSSGGTQDSRRSSAGSASEVDEQVVERKRRMVEEQMRALMQQKEGLDDLANLMRQEKARKKEKKKEKKERKAEGEQVTRYPSVDPPQVQAQPVLQDAPPSKVETYAIHTVGNTPRTEVGAQQATAGPAVGEQPL